MTTKHLISQHLVSIEKWTSGLSALLLAVALVLLSRQAMFALAVGCGLMVLNAWIMRRAVQAVGPVLQTKPGLVMVLFNFKLLILGVLIFVALRYLHLQPLPFIVGISTLPLAILIVGLRHQLTPTDAATPRAHDDEETK